MQSHCRPHTINGLGGEVPSAASPKEGVFQNSPRHVCVVIRSKTGGLLSPSEAPEPRVCADETTDPDCPEVKISLLQR